MSAPMTSMQRTLAALSQQEPDRVPLFLLTTLHGARELGLSVEAYFASAANVIEGQLRLREKYRSDCLYPFFYASIEAEAWGGSTLFMAEGPPLCGAPVIQRPEQIDDLQVPSLQAPGLQRVLAAIAGLKSRVGDTVPIIGVAIAPLSLPVMLMGFDRYLELMFEQPQRFWRLMACTERFCVDWANAQLAAGASTICYYDPVSSSTILSRERYLATGQPIARRVLAQIQGPTATHMASGRCLPILADLIDTGTAVVGVSTLEPLPALKSAAQRRVALLGNLNGIEMRHWTPAQAQWEVQRVLAQAGRGGGLVLSDNHGEIPWQVPETVLLAISEAAHRWGRYPLDWIDDWLAGEAGRRP